MLVIQSKKKQKKLKHNTKISETENKITNDHNNDKYITTQKFNTLTSENLTARLQQANLASKNNTANSIKKQILIIN